MAEGEYIFDNYVSRETLDQLYTYRDLLIKWQKAINLVSPKTIPDSWERHFLDSVQLLSYVGDKDQVIADLGSGGGFPGAVLAILRPDLDVHLVDSDYRKCQFLKAVSRETGCEFAVHTERAESVLAKLNPNLITARGFAPLVDLFTYCEGALAINDDLRFLLLKGRNAEQEVAVARAVYDFVCEMAPSQVEDESFVLMISAVRKKAA